MERDQLVRSAITLSTTIDTLNISNVPELQTLKEGLSVLQDAVFSPRGLSDAENVLPFYFLCSSLCDALCDALKSNLLRPHLDPGLDSVVLLGHRLPQFSELLLGLFHALNTLLNLELVICAKMLKTQTYNLCMSCVARSMHILEEYRKHLGSLDQDAFVMCQILWASTCHQVYQEFFQKLGINSLPSSFCDCVSRGSNRSIRYQEDICITRAGDAALNHFAAIGEKFIEEVNRKHDSSDNGDLERTKERFRELANRFREALRCLEPGETLVSYEILTRGYWLDFTGLPDAAMARLSLDEYQGGD